MGRRKSRKVCNKGRVNRLWEQNPNCYWCDTPTVRVSYQQVHLNPNSATFDHLHHKSEPKRHTRKGRHVGVLACYKCNQERGRVAHIASLPAWNRILIRYNIPIPVWKVKSFIRKTKKKFNSIKKNAGWTKRYLAYKLRNKC